MLTRPRAQSRNLSSSGLSDTVTVENLAALKALTSRPESVVVKTGQAAGTWQWVAGSATTADDALVVNPTSGTAGRYKRIYDGALHAAWFNAFPGVADVTTALQAAVDAAAGGELYIAPGRYVVSATLGDACVFLPASGITIRGGGRHQTVIETVSQAAHFAAVDAANIDIENVGFDGEQAANLDWQTGLVLRGCLRVRVANCWFYRIGRGAMNVCMTGFGGSDQIPNGTRQSERIQITDNLFEDCYGTVALVTKYVGTIDTIVTGNNFYNACSVAISIESEQGTASEWADRVVVANNNISGVDYARTNGFSNIAYGISVTEQARRITIANNNVYDVAGNTLACGIVISTSPSQNDNEVNNIVVSGNTVGNVLAATGRGYGVFYQTGDTAISNFTCIGNTIDACTAGIGIENAASTATLGIVSNLTITGNAITNSVENGIVSLITGGSGEVVSTNVSITANVIKNTTSSHGISVKLSKSTIVGNTVTGCGLSGISLLSGSSDVQVLGNISTSNTTDGIVATCDRLSISGNVCLNNGQGGATSYGIQVASGANALITLNRCGDTQTGAETQDYGIRAPSGATVRNNELVGNALGSLFGAITNFNTGAYDTGLNMVAAAATGTVTQATDKSTGVTLDRASGEITMNNAALNVDTLVSFTLTNSRIALGDVLVLNHLTGGTPGAYLLNARCAAGSAVINVRNITAGNLSEAIVIAFNVVKPFTA